MLGWIRAWQLVEIMHPNYLGFQVRIAGSFAFGPSLLS